MVPQMQTSPPLQSPPTHAPPEHAPGKQLPAQARPSVERVQSRVSVSSERVQEPLAQK